MRSWIDMAKSGKAYIASLEDGESASSAEGLLNEPKAKHPSWRDKEAAERFFWFMMPSFVARAFGHASDNSEIPAANATSYLNGLRGLASFIVTIAHSTDDFLWVYHGWGETAEDRYLVQLPIIRLAFCGTYMVTIFFVISGFVLTYGPLKKIHSGQGFDAISSLPSSIFRRPFRLFMPVVPILVITCILIHYQAFYSPPLREPLGPVANGIWSQITFIWHTLLTIITQNTTATIMPQGWTLSVEYQGSLLVFLCCIAFARTSALVRISCALGLFFLQIGVWQQCLFLSGMILADVRHARQKLPPLTGAAHKAANVASWLLLVFGLFLGGWPTHGNGYAAVGYSWFTWVPTAGMDPTRLFPAIGAVALVTALENLPVLQRYLNSRWALYLGEISFELYLVHWFVGRSSATWGLKFQMLDAGYSITVAWTVTFAIMLMLSIWFADVFWRLIDRKSVRFAHWLSKKLGI
ncbi:acyltransferase [Colletotrichum incanum]|uniref:Acyltransferase n=1 Tax=Colletotrichum incanum TaxID=1573173 RepID=A0A166TIR5_COLIC|nr:acyltransferase [Colletotrichum incanum]